MNNMMSNSNNNTNMMGMNGMNMIGMNNNMNMIGMNNNMNMMGINNMDMMGMNNNMNLMGMNNNMNMMGMNNNMNMMGINNNINMMGMNNNMNMMGMNNNMNMMGIGMGDINMGSLNDNLDNEDRDGWELTFKYNDGEGEKEVSIHISCEKTVQEAINKYKLEIANSEDMRFEYPPNKELNKYLKISQSGLSKNSVILVKAKKEDDYMTEEEEKNWAKANRGRRNAFYMKNKYKGDKLLRKNNNIN